MIMELTQRQLKDRLTYNPDTGVFKWLCGEPVSDIHNNQNRYNQIHIDGQYHKAHRLAWLYVHGIYPLNCVVFKDGDRSNCAIGNLRFVDSQIKRVKVIKEKVVESAPKNYYFNKFYNKYVAQRTIRGCRATLGYYDTEQEAKRAIRISLELNPTGAGLLL